MTLTAAQKKQYRAIAHNLNPIVTVGDNGLTEGLLNELNRALDDHELIKVKVAIGDRNDRAEIITELCNETNAILIQTIGKIAVVLRKAKQPNPKLSNLLRG